MAEPDTTFSDQARVAAAMAAVETPMEGEVIDAPVVEEPPEPAEAPEDGEAPVADEAEEKPAEGAPEAAADPPEPELEAPLLAKIAKRERRQRDEHKARMAEIKEQEEALAERTKSLEAFEVAKARVQSDPVAFFESLGIKEGFANIASQLWHRELGDDAPAEFKQQQQYRTAEARILELERRHEKALEDQKAQMEQIQTQQRVREFDARNESYLKNLGDSMPHLAAEAAGDMHGAKEAMANVALMMFEQDSSHTPEPAEIATYIEEQLEKSMAKFGHLYAKKNGKPAAKDEEPIKPITTTTTTRKRAPALTDAERIARATAAYAGE